MKCAEKSEKICQTITGGLWQFSFNLLRSDAAFLVHGIDIK
jgi:hypothetical protein